MVQEIVERHILLLCKMLLNSLSGTGLDTKTIVTGVIVPIIIAIISIIKVFLGKESYFSVSWNSSIEYSLKDFKQQSRYVRFKAFKLTFIHGATVIVGTILCYIFIELLGELLAWGYCLVWLIVFAYFLRKYKIHKIYMNDIIRVQKGKTIKKQLTKLIFSYSCFFILLISIITPTICILKNTSVNGDPRYLLLMVTIFIGCVLFMMFEPYSSFIVFYNFPSLINPLKNYNESEDIESFESVYKEHILTDGAQVNLLVCCCITLNSLIYCYIPEERYISLGMVGVVGLGFLFLIYNICANYYGKMMNMAFLYYYKDGKRRYIYRKIDNQVLCGNKDYLQCDRETFDDKIKEIQNTIENQNKKEETKLDKEEEELDEKKTKLDKEEEELDKKKTKLDKEEKELDEKKKKLEELDEKKKELNKCIDELKPYSGYIKIDEGIGKACFNVLTNCVGKLEKCKGNLDKFDMTRLTKEVDEIIQVFQKMTAVKLLPEDELKNYTIYPIIDMERNRFF